MKLTRKRCTCSPRLSLPAVAGLRVRLGIMAEIWQLLVAVFSIFLVTLLVFPGLVSEVQHCSIGDWAPIILVTVFNVTDLAAKVLCAAELGSSTVCTVLPAAVCDAGACAVVAHSTDDSGAGQVSSGGAHPAAGGPLSLPAHHPSRHPGLGSGVCCSARPHQWLLRCSAHDPLLWAGGEPSPP